MDVFHHVIVWSHSINSASIGLSRGQPFLRFTSGNSNENQYPDGCYYFVVDCVRNRMGSYVVVMVGDHSGCGGGGVLDD